MKRWLLMSILGTLILGGCGSPPEVDPAEEAEKIKQTSYSKDIAGVWTGACTANLDVNLPAKSIRVNYTITDGRFLERHDAYESTDCSGVPLYFFRKSGRFTILTEREETVRQINIVNEGIEIVPNVGGFTDYLNDNSVCGYENWMIARGNNVGGRTCWGITAYPRGNRYDIFSLTDDNQKLCFGKADEPATNGARASQRPTALGLCYDLVSDGVN